MNHHHRICTLAFCLALLLLLSSGCKFGTAMPVWTEASRRSVTIPFEFYDRHIYLKATVNDVSPLWFVLDTGDKYAVIDTARARALGVKSVGRIPVGGAGEGSISASYVLRGRFALAGVKGFSQPLSLAMPLDHMAQVTGHPFDGIVGSDFMNQFVVEIDYANRTLTLYDKKEFTYHGDGEILPITFTEEGHPTVEAQLIVNGRELKRGKFLVDIGAGHAVVANAPFVEEQGLPKAARKTAPMIAEGMGGFTTGLVTRADGLRLGKWLIEQPPLQLSQDNGGAHASAAWLGSIGSQVMQRFRVFLDYGNKRMILEATPQLTEPFPYDASGLLVESFGADYRQYRIAKVLDGSPAAEASVREGEILLTVDGHPAGEYSLAEIRQLLQQEKEFDLGFNSGSSTRYVKLKTRQLI